MTGVQLVVTYNDHTIMYYPVERGWRISNPHRCVVIGRGLSRTYIPLDAVRSFDVEEYEVSPPTPPSVDVSWVGVRGDKEAKQ